MAKHAMEATRMNLKYVVILFMSFFGRTHFNDTFCCISRFERLQVT